MDPTQTGSSTFQTLASVLAGGLAGYVDAQNNQPVAVVAPSPSTAYGYAGAGQPTPSGLAATVSGSPVFLLVIVGVVVYLIAKR